MSKIVLSEIYTQVKLRPDATVRVSNGRVPTGRFIQSALFPDLEPEQEFETVYIECQLVEFHPTVDSENLYKFRDRAVIVPIGNVYVPEFDGPLDANGYASIRSFSLHPDDLRELRSTCYRLYQKIGHARWKLTAEGIEEIVYETPKLKKRKRKGGQTT